MSIKYCGQMQIGVLSMLNRYHDECGVWWRDAVMTVAYCGEMP